MIEIKPNVFPELVFRSQALGAKTNPLLFPDLCHFLNEIMNMKG